MDIKDQRILVIGGAGLIGSHVVEELLKEPVKEVVVFDNFSRGTMGNLQGVLQDSRCRVFELGGDVCQRDILDKAVEGVDAIISLKDLWLLHCHDFPESAFEVNIRGTFNILMACVKHNIKRLVYSSSASVYGDALTPVIHEDHPYNNWTFYGATKIAGEHMMKAFHKRYGLEGVGLRYMNVYGPRQDYKGAYIAVMMKILDSIDKGQQPVIYGDGSQSYDFVHVKDCARANVCALKANVPFGFYNVGREVKTSIKELAEILLELTGTDLKIKYEPAGLTFVTNRVGSTAAAERDLGYKWTIELREGLQSLIDWRRQNIEELELRRKKSMKQ